MTKKINIKKFIDKLSSRQKKAVNEITSRQKNALKKLADKGDYYKLYEYIHLLVERRMQKRLTALVEIPSWINAGDTIFIAFSNGKKTKIKIPNDVILFITSKDSEEELMSLIYKRCEKEGITDKDDIRIVYTGIEG